MCVLSFNVRGVQKPVAHYTYGVQQVLWGPTHEPHMFKEFFEGQNLVLWLMLEYGYG